MALFNECLVFSLILFIIWLIIFLFNKGIRKEMFWISLFTMPFGLTEPLFVPEYWNPPSLFNLAAITGFDIESLIFSLAIGGIGSVLYVMLFKAKQIKMNRHEIHGKRHQYHLLALLSPVAIFALLHLLTELNPIYSASIAMLIGGIATTLCRPDLKKEILMGAFYFSCFISYFSYFSYWLIRMLFQAFGTFQQFPEY